MTTENAALPYATCKPIVRQCVAKQPGAVVCMERDVAARCGPDNVSITDSVSCTGLTPDCVDGRCTACSTNAKRCSGDGVETCQQNGTWGSPQVCSVAAPHCVEGACRVEPPSCAGLNENCGATGDESCCLALAVPGGTFYRSYDGATYTNQSYPATVSSFGLDKFEITVGRFRTFVGAMLSGYHPPAGAGRHTHLNGGRGLVGPDGNYEPGWNEAWLVGKPVTAGEWDAYLSCGTGGTWTNAPGDNETKPLNCLDWYDAYAFCIWDGGFLPSEAEWNYAAAGGSEQRVYPWSVPPTSTSIDCSYATYLGPTNSRCGTNESPNAVGSKSPKGNGRFGHADLAGNVPEWVFDQRDYYASLPYTMPCADCARLDPKAVTDERALRGGGAGDFDFELNASVRVFLTAAFRRSDSNGARCARAP